jgi:hypothetical protein
MTAKPETVAQVQALLEPFICNDRGADVPVIPNYITDYATGERFRSLMAKQVGRALRIWSTMDESSLREDPNDPKRLYIKTKDPIVGWSTHVVVRHTNTPWEVFGVQKLAGNGERLTTPAFSRWANIHEPQYGPDGSPLNLAAMNIENAKHLPNYRARHADMNCDKHLLVATLASPNQVLAFPRDAAGNIPDWVWNAIALGYEAEEASETTPYEVVIRN